MRRGLPSIAVLGDAPRFRMLAMPLGGVLASLASRRRDFFAKSASGGIQ